LHHIDGKKELLILTVVMRLLDVKDLEAISPVFRGKWGHRLAELSIRLLAVEKLNRVYARLSNYTGAEFASRFINELGVNYAIGNTERLKLLPEGAFITISNHPYGGLDGVIMIDLMASIRPDYKFMANKIGEVVKTMKDNLIFVSPTGDKKTGITAANLFGIRETLTWFKEGHPVGFFPSGAVSDFSLKDMRVRDREWQENILNLIYSVKIPVLPIRFYDNNSLFFYFLGLFNSRIRLMRMVYELFNKNKKQQRIGIGNIISVEEQKQFPDARSLGIFLRKNVYEMPLPDKFIPRNQLDLSVK
jgi:putative hemolysin